MIITNILLFFIFCLLLSILYLTFKGGISFIEFKDEFEKIDSDLNDITNLIDSINAEFVNYISQKEKVITIQDKEKMSRVMTD